MKTNTGGVLAGLVLLVCLSGCGGSSESDAAGSSGGVTTGLYEGGNGPRRNQLCLISREGRSAGFGFIIWGEGDRNCSAKGVARPGGERLRLLLDGDESCAIDARIEGGRLVLPTTIAPECARYYCGERVAMADAPFTRSGTTEADARRATDLVGDPLCAG